MQVLGIDINIIRGILMIVLIVAFLGMWAWAWSKKRSSAFYDASMLPLEEDRGEIPTDGTKES